MGLQEKPFILAVDDFTHELNLCKNLLKEHFTVFAASSAALMFEALEAVIPDLILLDVLMPVMNGYEAAKLLKSNERYKDIPIIFATSLTDEMNEAEGFSIGAADYIHKPYRKEQMVKRINAQLALQKIKRENNELKLRLEKLAKSEVRNDDE